MMEYKSFLTSGKLGDIIYQIPVIQHYKGNLYLNTINPPYYLKNSVDYKSLLPLLEYQNIEFRMWNKEPYWGNLDDFRINYNYKDNLLERICWKFNVPVPQTWLKAPVKKIAPTVFNRTFRYRNNPSKFKEYLQDAIFIGHKDEYDDFVYQIGKVSYYECRDLLEMASVINGSELFIGNQSCGMAMAIGMGKSFLQETCPSEPNCVFKLANAQYC